MTYPIPAQPKIYHIVHYDKLPAILASGGLLSDAEMIQRKPAGTIIGMDKIKKRRLNELTLSSHQGLHVGDCVPFYFCPRSVMLYIFYMDNHPEIEYHGGEEPIIHLEADLHKVVQWANTNKKRWAFTLSNAGSTYFEDRADLAQLSEVNWEAVQATHWSGCREEKQSEFLIEQEFPWELIEQIGVYSQKYYHQVNSILSQASHQPPIDVKRDWYY